LSPGRCTNRQNLRNCQRTIMFLLFLFQESIKSVRLYVACFQSSAGRPQAGDRILCRGGERFKLRGRWGAGFRDIEREWKYHRSSRRMFNGCEYPGKALLSKGFGLESARDYLALARFDLFCRGNGSLPVARYESWVSAQAGWRSEMTLRMRFGQRKRRSVHVLERIRRPLLQTARVN
jgi:hypothetical protein